MRQNETEKLLTRMGKVKAFKHLQNTYGSENVTKEKQYKGNTIRKVVYYGNTFEIWRKNEEEAFIFNF